MRKRLLMLLTLLLPAALLLMGAAPRQVMLYEFGDNGLTQYLQSAEDCPAAWRVMIALDLVQENDLSAPQKDELIQRAALFSGCESEEDALDLLTPALREKAESALARLSYRAPWWRASASPLPRAFPAPIGTTGGRRAPSAATARTRALI